MKTVGNLIYVLVKENLPCFKLGITSNIDRRLSSLACYAPFSESKSHLIKLDRALTKKQLENGIGVKFRNYNLHIQKIKNKNSNKKDKTNGETEWYDIACLKDMVSEIRHFLKQDDGIRQAFVPFGDEKVKLVAKNANQKECNKNIEIALECYQSKKANQKVRKHILKIENDLHLVGVHNKSDENNASFLLVTNNSPTKQKLNDFSIEASAKNKKTFANICTSIVKIDNKTYYDFKIPISLKQNWTSEDIVERTLSHFYELAKIKPLSEEYIKTIEKTKDWFKSGEVIFTGIKALDNYIFKCHGMERFLPHKMPQDIFEIIMKEANLDDENKYPNASVLLIILMIITAQETGFLREFPKDYYISRSINRLSEDISQYQLYMILESIKRKGGFIKEYTEPTIKDIFLAKELGVTFETDFLKLAAENEILFEQ